MKLDKIKFAQLVAYLTNIGAEFTFDSVRDIDSIIDVEMPEQPIQIMNPEQLHALMALMQEGERKIEAIKQHRMMTGYGLKESKDIVEKYWQSNNARKSEVEMLKRLNSSNYSDEDYNTINTFLNNAYR